MTIFYHPDYMKHRQSYGHPECPERLGAIMNMLDAQHLLDELKTPPKPGNPKVVEAVHDKTYIDMMESFGEGYLDPDTFHREDTFEIAVLAACGGLLAAEYSYEHKKPSFAIVRPPGHHSGRDYAGGFCYFNNIAIAAKDMLDKKGAKKVAIIDYDVHHGNGTEDIFYKSSKVLYISTHQWGIYPGTGHSDNVGEDDGEGFTVNIPFNGGAGDTSFELAYEKVIQPVLIQYKPDMILVSLGADGHYQDMISSLTLSSQGYIKLAKSTMDLASELCDGRIAFMLEGGYHLEALAEVVTGIVGGFYGKTTPLQYRRVADTGRNGFDEVYRVRQAQSDYWELQ